MSATTIPQENTKAIAANTKAIADLVDAVAAEAENRRAADADAVKEAKAYADAVAKTPYTLPKADAATLGGVKPDGTSTTVDADGFIHAHTSLPVASQTTLGGVRVDGTTIVIRDGVISCHVAGSSADLAGRTVDISTQDGLFEAVKLILETLGATVYE